MLLHAAVSARFVTITQMSLKYRTYYFNILVFSIFVCILYVLYCAALVRNK